MQVAEHTCSFIAEGATAEGVAVLAASVCALAVPMNAAQARMVRNFFMFGVVVSWLFVYWAAKEVHAGV